MIEKIIFMVIESILLYLFGKLQTTLQQSVHFTLKKLGIV